MKRAIMIVTALAAGLLLAGCLQINTTISVNKDGSGTIDQKFLMKSDMMAMMSGLSSMGQDNQGDSAQSDNGFSLFDKQQLEKDAAKMGNDVRLVSAEPLKTDFGEGYHAVYAFKDVTRIQINQNPGDNLPSQMQQGGSETASQTPDYVRFGFRAGSPSVLTITFPEPQKQQGNGTADSTANQKMSEQDLAMIMQFYQDMRITTDVVFNGSIVSTNASYRTGNRVTLLDFQFNKLLDNPEFKKQLMEGKSEQMSNFQNLGKMFPGMMIETKPTVEVRFR
ncbi:hypothetical protein [Salinispira pacifica]